MIFALSMWMEINLSSSPTFDGEPVVAVNPSDENNIVVAWIKAALGRSFIALRYSSDGGYTWSDVFLMPHISDEFNSADPTLYFSPHGILYLAYIDYDLTSGQGYVLLSRSHDGGVTWTSPEIIISYLEGEDYPIDRPWITGAGDTLYITSIETAILGATPPYHVFFRYSTDGGNTWSPLLSVGDSSYPPGWVRSMGQLTSSHDTVFLAYYSYDPSIHPLPGHVLAISTDGGNTFQYRIIDRLNPSVAVDTLLKRGTPLVYSKATGILIATRIGDDFGDADVLYYRSLDNGETWSGPIRMNDDPASTGVYQDMLWGCSRDSIVALFWRDRRNYGAGLEVPFDIYGTISTDGGFTFGSNFRVNTQPSMYDSLLTIRGNDFMGCDVGSERVYVVWGDLRDTSSHLDIYIAGINIEDVNKEEGEKIERGPTKSRIPFSPSGRKTRKGIILIYPDGRKVIQLR